MYGLPSAGGAARGVAGGAPPPPPAGGVVRGRPPAREAPKPASSARATAGQLLLLRGYGELRGELDENLKPITFQSNLLFLVSQSQALDTSPSVSMTGRQANCQDRRAPASRTRKSTQSADYGSLYEIEQEHLINLLSKCDRTQWNSHVVQGLSPQDAADARLDLSTVFKLR